MVSKDVQNLIPKIKKVHNVHKRHEFFKVHGVNEVKEVCYNSTITERKISRKISVTVNHIISEGYPF